MRNIRKTLMITSCLLIFITSCKESNNEKISLIEHFYIICNEPPLYELSKEHIRIIIEKPFSNEKEIYNIIKNPCLNIEIKEIENYDLEEVNYKIKGHTFCNDTKYWDSISVRIDTLTKNIIIKEKVSIDDRGSITFELNSTNKYDHRRIETTYINNENCIDFLKYVKDLVDSLD